MRKNMLEIARNQQILFYEKPDGFYMTFVPAKQQNRHWGSSIGSVCAFRIDIVLADNDKTG